MELDEFKKDWQSYIENDFKNSAIISEKIKGITMNTVDTLSELTNKNRQWWKSIKTFMSLLLIILGINLLMYFIVPDKFQHIENAFPYFVIIFSFALISVILYYIQFKIFDIDISVDLKSILEKAIGQYRKFYIVYNVTYLFLFPVLFYFVMKVTFKLFQVEISVNLGMWLSGILTIVCLGINHLYYKKKYFRTILKLKNNLKELTSD